MAYDDGRGQQFVLARRALLTKLFRTFASRWRVQFHANRVVELLPVWTVACERLDEDGLEAIAIDFTAKSASKFPPSPDEFVRYAMGVQRKRFEGLPTAPQSNGVRREWQWQNPGSRRLARVEERDNGWVVMSVDDYVVFMAYDDRAKVEYCEHMVRVHGLGQWSAA